MHFQHNVFLEHFAAKRVITPLHSLICTTCLHDPPEREALHSQPKVDFFHPPMLACRAASQLHSPPPPSTSALGHQGPQALSLSTERPSTAWRMAQGCHFTRKPKGKMPGNAVHH